MTQPAGITQAQIERAIKAQVRTGIARDRLAVIVRKGEVLVAPMEPNEDMTPLERWKRDQGRS